MHGEEIAVVIDIMEYRQLRGASLIFMDYLRAEPAISVDFEVERRQDMPRETDLAG